MCYRTFPSTSSFMKTYLKTYFSRNIISDDLGGAIKICSFLFLFFKYIRFTVFTMDYKSKLTEAIASLNEIQRDLILSEEKKLRVYAGPGSGKTKGTCGIEIPLMTDR